jgi:hypothetical protein
MSPPRTALCLMTLQVQIENKQIQARLYKHLSHVFYSFPNTQDIQKTQSPGNKQISGQPGPGTQKTQSPGTRQISGEPGPDTQRTSPGNNSGNNSGQISHSGQVPARQAVHVHSAPRAQSEPHMPIFVPPSQQPGRGDAQNPRGGTGPVRQGQPYTVKK